MRAKVAKDLVWVSTSLRDLRRFPDTVVRVMGFALFQAQSGGKHVQAKPLKGFKGGGILEVVEDFDGNTYRAVYAVCFAEAVYVLHVFQKKSRRGIETPRHEMELVRSRLSLIRNRPRHRE